MEKKAKVELLAPAGNAEAFYGAIHAGADAVYLGGNRFGARAYAENFTEEELIQCIRYAHIWGRKVYLTVNTLVKEAEFSELYDYICPYYKAGLDGVIIQDIGVLSFVREHFPGMELHASTQMTLTSAAGVKLLQNMGVCRVVPARELCLSEIRTIKEETGVTIEAFVHGAMCYCYSGQCLFSSILGGRSGNRGRCAQPCRLPYRVGSAVDSNKKGKQNNKNGQEKYTYPLSLKDMCTVEHISELIEGGIDSFKIEGRMKKPEYAAGVTAVYRKYIDAYYEGRSTKVSAKDLEILAGLYIRSERQNGYYYKHNGKDMVTLDSPAYSGSDEAEIARIRNTYLDNKPKQAVSMKGKFITGQKAELTITCNHLTVTVTGHEVQVAGKQPVTEENIRKQLGKLGDSTFTTDEKCGGNIEIDVSVDAFYPIGAINALRRQAVSLMEDELINAHGLIVSRTVSCDVENTSVTFLDKYAEKTENSEKTFSISVRTMEQLDALCQTLVPSVKRVYINGDLLVADKEKCLEYGSRLSAHNMELIVSLPVIIRKRDSQYLNNLFEILNSEHRIFSGIQVKSLDGMGMAKKYSYSGKIYTDSSFYIWNRKTLQEWSGDISGFCLPLELKGGEQKTLLHGVEVQNQYTVPACEKTVYGYIPMMVTANCVANTTSGCVGKRHITSITDRYQKVFPVECNCLHCMNIIYNSVPLSLHGELSKWKGGVTYKLDFTIESADETREIIFFYTGQKSERPFADYTTGHEKRGVE